MMPVLDRFGVLDTLRSDTRLRSTPVIVLTAKILTRNDMARMQKGVAAVLGNALFTEAEVIDQVVGALTRAKRLGGEAQRVARQAMAYIHEHYAEPVSRGDLARQLAVSERCLTRCFRAETGLTPVGYLTRYRVFRAQTLLEETTLSATEIGLACGFSDRSCFGRVFQREVGVLPGAYHRGEHRAETRAKP
jgi:transcriptional regulator GlxA family with amidase domain